MKSTCLTIVNLIIERCNTQHDRQTLQGLQRVYRRVEKRLKRENENPVASKRAVVGRFKLVLHNPAEGTSAFAHYQGVEK